MRTEAAALAEAADRLQEALSRRKRRRVKARLERQLQRQVSKAFLAQGRAFLAEWNKLDGGQIQEAIRDSDWEPLWARVARKTLSLFTRPLNIAIRASLVAGAKEANGSPWTIKDPAAVEFLRDRAADRVSLVNETTKKRLNTIISDGRDAGLSHRAIAKQIQDEFKQFAVGKPQQHIDSRAHLVAVTEVGEAYTEGTLQAAKRLEAIGLPQEKSWLDSGDDRVSDGCLVNAGAGWIPLDDAFPSGHQRPLRFPGCRCDLLTRRKK